MKVSIFSAHDISNAYSCLFYLKKALEEQEKISVSIFGAADKNEMPKILKNGYYCLKPGKLGKKSL